jgi:CBS domain-containing protein
MPRSLTDPLVRDAHVLAASDTIKTAVRHLLDSDLPALPVCDEQGKLAGIFGEREFFQALFPGYLNELKSASFVSRAMEVALEKRHGCSLEPVGDHVHTDHVDVDKDFSDAQVAETFLHHRVLVLPVLDAGKVVGVITRGDFFRALAEKFLEPT